MTMNYEQWKRMLSAVDKEEGLSKDNVIEKIKEKLKAENGEDEYKKWEEAGFDVNHLFETGDTLPSWFLCDKLTLLHSAARNNLGNVADVLSKVEGIDVNAAAKNPEYTPLHIAALYNSEKAAGALLKAKEIDVNAATFFLPPLHLAISSYSHKIVEVLCKERPDIINAKNKDGYTPLHQAIFSSNEQAICILLKNGADVNVVDECRNTPLHEAACRSNTDILNILIRNGASIDEVNKFGNTPLHQAVNHKREKVVNILIENGANVNAIGKGGYAPLYLAVENNHVGIVNSLLKREDIKVNIMDGDGDTPLYKAASKGYIKVVDTLLKAKGINVNVMNRDGDTPLYEAVFNGHIEVVDALLKAEGINVNAEHGWGYTPLHYAASYGHKKMVDTLLKAEGININAVHKPYLWTPLHLAAKNGHIDIVRALVEKGIDLLLKDQNGKTPRDLAKNDDMKELLKEAEETQLRQLAIKRATKNGIIAGCLTALLGTAAAVALFVTGTVAVELIPIVIAVVAIAAAALAVGGITYMMLKPSTKVEEVEEEQGITGNKQKA